MRSRDVVGRRILDVKQERVYDESGGLCMDIKRFTLSGGKEIVFNTHEQAYGDPTVDALVVTHRVEDDA